MSTANAKDAAAQWLVEHKVPDDLSGRTVNLVTFDSDEDCFFFYPRRVLVWQQKVNKFIGRQVSKRGAKIVRHSLTPVAYREWLKIKGTEDTPVRRREYADGFQGWGTAAAS